MLVGNIIELLLFSTPSFLYRARLRRRGHCPGDASAAVGLRIGAGSDYALAAIVLAVTAGLGYASLRLIPVPARHSRGQPSALRSHSPDTSASRSSPSPKRCCSVG